MPLSSKGRMYSKKSATKRGKSFGDEKQEESGMPAVQPRKKRKISVEVIDDPEYSSPSPERRSGNVVRTYGSPNRAKKLPLPIDIDRTLPGVTHDLSKIEAITPSSSPSLSPTKLAKRMLARSKTESSIDNQTNVTSFDRTPSLPNFPTSSPPKPSTSTLPDSPPIHRAPLSTTTRTYAGKSRSFLVAIPTSTLSLSNGILPDEEDDSTRESYASLRTRWGIDNSEDDPHPTPLLASPSKSSAASTPRGTPRKGKGKAVQDTQQTMHIPNGMMNPLKSITELRSKGESRRFLDEVGYLFEGMEAAGGVGLRRASALEITTKLCDPEFARKAKAADFLGRTWDLFVEAGAGRGDDKVLDTLIVFFAVLVARDPADLADLAERTLQSSPLPISEKGKQKQNEMEKSPSSVVDTLFSLLRVYSSSDPLALVSPFHTDRTVQDAELKKMGLQKKDRTLFRTIYNTIISRSLLFPADTPISTPFLIMHTLQSLPPSLVPVYHLSTLLGSIRTIVSPLLHPSSPSSISWPDTAPDIHFDNIYYHLRMLDMYLLGQWGAATPGASESGQRSNELENAANVQQASNLPTMAMDSARSWLTNALITLGIYTEIRGGALAKSVTEITLRVLVSLTHGDATWAMAVVKCECANALAWVVRIVLRFEWGVKNREQEVKKEEGVVAVVAGDDVSEGETQALDRLCLALGLLTNLVQVVEETKDLLHEIRLHPSCTLENRSCIRRCTCASPPSSSSNSETVINSAIDVLVQLYLHHLPPPTPASESTPSIPIKKESESSPSPPQEIGSGTGKERDTVDASFLRGHLAVLFGLLMRGNPTNEAYILDALGLGERAENGLERLVEHAREFATFYAVISATSRAMDEDEEAEAGIMTEGIRESKVASDVVLFLESLKVRKSLDEVFSTEI